MHKHPLTNQPWQLRKLRNAISSGVRLQWPRLLLSLCLSGCAIADTTAAGNGNVYVSYDENGDPRYANYPLDADYVLFIAGPVPVAAASPPKSLTPELQARKTRLTPLINRYAKQYQLAPALVSAVIAIESGYNSAAVSPKGARGAMQLMPATAARYGVVNHHDPAQNIEAGVRYLKELMQRYDGNVALALAAYNAGEGAVKRHGARIPPYHETMLYVPAVMAQQLDQE